jgi:predicted membrane chloride channel (bestrophin family)
LKTIKHFVSIIDHQTIIVTILSLLTTWLCRRFGFAADMPSGLIGVAIVFPIVFSINAAYRRRESALNLFSDLKGHALGLHYIHRDWAREEEEGAQAVHRERSRELFTSLLKNMNDYFHAKGQGEEEHFNRVFATFSEYSSSFEALRKGGMSAGEISRANQYLRAMIIDFEKMRNILRYRTPLTLRAYSRVFLNIFPIIFGPYFAHLADKSYPAVGYLVAIAYSLVLVSLDNIQEDLEDPFDGVGADDVNLDVGQRYEKVMGG